MAGKLTAFNSNPQRLFLGWLRATNPAVYTQALRRATGATRSLGGLTRNLAGLGDDNLETIDVTGDSYYTGSQVSDFMPTDILPTLSESDFASPAIDGTSLPELSISPDVTAAVNAAASSSSSDSSGSSSVFSSLINAVSNIASTALKTSSTTSAQNQLLQLNATRAQQGLPPVNAAGQVISSVPAGSSAIQQLEASLGGSGGMGSIVLYGGVGLLLYLFLRRRRTA